MKKYISNVNILFENINKDFESLTKKLELLTDVNNVRLDEKNELFKNIIKNKVQIGGSGVSENLQMNRDIEQKIIQLQDKVTNIKAKAILLQDLTKQNFEKTTTNKELLAKLTSSVDSVLGEPEVTEKINELTPKELAEFAGL
jgi:hypothetical protein